MRLQGVRQWQWLVAGALCGLLVGDARAAWGPAYRDEVSRTISQAQFERGVCSPRGAPLHLNGLVVHPPDEAGARWVTGTLHERSAEGERIEPFKFRAPTPFRPKVALGSDLTVDEYLSQIAARIPQAELRFRYAWEEAPGATVGLWAAIGAVVIGVVWPLVLRRLTGPAAGGIEFGLLSRVLSASTAEQRKPVTTHAIDSLNEQLEAQLGTSAAAFTAPPLDEDAPAAPTIKVLKAEPVEPAAATEAQPPKAYGGDYYPTEAHGRPPTSRATPD
jgi:hypothetical protein